MTALITSPQVRSLPVETVGELLDRLGGVAPSRVRMRPALGTATETDVTDIHRREKRLFELVDGVLVEKVMSYRESVLALAIAFALKQFIDPRKLGIVSGADGMMQLFPGLVRIPDVAFVSATRLPGGRMPQEPVPQLVPNLAVEVLSEGNTEAEMRRKLQEYFGAGVELVWFFDLRDRTVTTYTDPDHSQTLRDTLPGGGVIPGFSVSISSLFAQLDFIA